MHFIYILRCGDNSLYTGYTNDVTERVKAHNSGKGAKYTRSRLPVSLVYYKRDDRKSIGLKLEARIKKLTKKEKEALVKAFNLEK